MDYCRGSEGEISKQTRVKEINKRNDRQARRPKDEGWLAVKKDKLRVDCGWWSGWNPVGMAATQATCSQHFLSNS